MTGPYPEQQPPSPYDPQSSSPPQQPYGPPPQQPYGQYPQPPYGLPPGYHPPAPNEGMAVASLVVGIASLVLSCLYGIGLLGSPVALVLGRISRRRIDASHGQLGGRGMAQAGFILGIVGTVLLVLAIIALVVVIVVAVNGGFDDGGTSYNY